MIDWAGLKAFERENADDLCRHFFPQGKKIGQEWRVGSVSAEPGLSLRIQLAGDAAGLWRDWATGQAGNFHKLVALNRKCSEAQAVKLVEQAFGASFSRNEAANTNDGKDVPNKDSEDASFSWPALVGAVTDNDLTELAGWRGYSPEFCRLLRDNQVIGRYDDAWALPVTGSATSRILGAHVKNKKNWFVTPSGIPLAPLIIGDLATALMVFVCESQWDGFAVLDRLAGLQTDGVAMVATRGAANARKLADLAIPKTSRIILLPQNDEAGQKWANDVILALNRSCEQLPTPAAFKDANDWIKAGATNEQLQAFETFEPTPSEAETESNRFIEILSPKQIKNYEPPACTVLVGDNHITRGSVFVIGGSPGVGKSRSAVALAVAGATGFDWFGLKVHSRFKTLIVQNENGRFRLKQEFAELDEKVLDEYVRVTPPPPYGLCFDRLEFRCQLGCAIEEFGPDIVVIDPWNAASPDEKAKTMLETFNLIRAVIPNGDGQPAIGIVAHTHKPRINERSSGRSLLNLLAGSYVLGSVPRCVFIMQAASDEVTDDRVVWTCCKNNDGELGARSVWKRSNGLFAPVSAFDWCDFDFPETGKESGITKAQVAAVFEHGKLRLKRSEAVKRLMNCTDKKHSACYEALKTRGKFRENLFEEDGLLGWRA